jgi:hypothetical protein
MANPVSVWFVGGKSTCANDMPVMVVKITQWPSDALTRRRSTKNAIVHLPDERLDQAWFVPRW